MFSTRPRDPGYLVLSLLEGVDNPIWMYSIRALLGSCLRCACTVEDVSERKKQILQYTFESIVMPLSTVRRPMLEEWRSTVLTLKVCVPAVEHFEFALMSNS